MRTSANEELGTLAENNPLTGYEPNCGIESQYISLSRRLFTDQKGSVSTDKESDMFETTRRTKQEDPLSSTSW